MKFKYYLVRYLANLQFAIILLLSIAGVSTVGSVIEQNQPPEYYQTNYAPELGKLFNSTTILNFGFDHIFRTWWFILLLVLFGSSLLCCTFLQQLPILTSARKLKFYQSGTNYNILPFRTEVVPVPNGSYITLLGNAD